MKIAFVFPPMWTPDTDGSLQIWNREVAAHISKNCDVTVYTAAFNLPHHHVVEGVQYRRFSTLVSRNLIRVCRHLYRLFKVKRPLFSTDLWYIFYALKVALHLRKRGCDVAHVYNFPQFANLIKRINPASRVVLNMHGEWLSQVPFSNLAARLARVDLILACSDFITKSISARFPFIASRCKTVPMGLSPSVFSISSNRFVPPPRLLYTGRISPEKGVHVLIDAFEIVGREYPDATLTIVGPEWIAPRENIVDLCLDEALIKKLAPFYEGDYLAQLMRRSSSTVTGRISFVGPVPYDKVSSYYAAANIYVSPSFYESFGMSIIEAMAAGLPVIATQTGAVPDIVLDRRTGLLVPPDDPSAIASAVHTLVADTRLRESVSSTGREMVGRLFSWATVASTLLNMYVDLIPY